MSTVWLARRRLFGSSHAAQVNLFVFSPVTLEGHHKGLFSVVLVLWEQHSLQFLQEVREATPRQLISLIRKIGNSLDLLNFSAHFRISAEFKLSCFFVCFRHLLLECLMCLSRISLFFICVCCVRCEESSRVEQLTSHLHALTHKNPSFR